MKTCLYVTTLLVVGIIPSQRMVGAQDNSNNNTPPPAPRALPVDAPVTTSVTRTNSMSVLDDKKHLGAGDRLSFRVVEDREDESQHLRINDTGDLEVPYVGQISAEGKTCRQLAYDIKSQLEKEYYYHATVIVGLEQVSHESRGMIYVYGSVKGQGPQEIPPNEVFTVSKAIIRAGGFGDFADKRKIKVTRKNPGKNGEKDLVVDLKRIIEQGHTEEDVVLHPDDQIYVPARTFNM